MKSNFAFLNNAFPVLANFGELAEKYCYSDSNSCLMKLGMIGETIVNLMFAYEKIEPPADTIDGSRAVNRIDKLIREELLTSDIAAILHRLRRIRNKAVHENYSSVDDSKSCLEMAYALCEWFMQVYGDWHYEHHNFIMPAESDMQKLQTVDVEDEKTREEQLIKEAKEKAQDTPTVPHEERRRQVIRVASRRQMSEAETRDLIDEQLRMVGWEADSKNICYSKGVRPAKGHNYAIAEYPTDSTTGNMGRADYALFIDEKLVGIIEAKAAHISVYSVIDYQCKEYPKNIRAEDAKYQVGTWGEYKVPFTFATNGRPYLKQYEEKSGIWFLDLRKPDNVPKALHGWMSPDGLKMLLAKDDEVIAKENEKLAEMSDDLLIDKSGLNLRSYQIKAIKAVEKAVIAGQDRVLLAMATGTGKTRTILGMIYRFLKTGRFSRILFLVDRNALGEQAFDVFKEVKIEDLHTINEIYDIKGVDNRTINSETKIHISTVQGMVKRIMYNDGGTMPAVSDYDLIIVDEAHRGYIFDKDMDDDEYFYRDQRDYQSKYRSVLEYFNAVKIGMTATPALQTTEIFGEPVFQYTYREAVIDGYLVDHDAPHILETQLSTDGIRYKRGDTILLFDPETGEIINGPQIDDEVKFDVDKFNKQIITPGFNKVVLTEIAHEIDPESPSENGKTLIYAVNDEHADMIVKILKEIYSESGVSNNAVMKITGSVGGGNRRKINGAIRQFKNEDYPSIVVTVDLLTTGIDVPSITTLVFLRCVKSRILFEQMLGRATRLCPKIHKTHFEIYDAVRVYDFLGDLSTIKPVVTSPSTSFTQLLDELKEMTEKVQVKKQITQIVAKLQRKKRNMDQKTEEYFKGMSKGLNVNQFIDYIEQMDTSDAKKYLLDCYDLFKMLDDSHPIRNYSVVYSDKKDELTGHYRGYGKSNAKPKDYLEEFSKYVKNNINEIAALKIICTKPRDLTRDSLKSLMLKLDVAGYTENQLNMAISQLTNKEMAADIISLIRRCALGSKLVSHEEKIEDAVEKLCNAHDFSKMELNWIKRMKEYLIKESVLNIQVFDEDSRFKTSGGFTRINKVFGNKLESIVSELNKYLYDDGGNVA